MRALGEMTELHVRTVRAILGCFIKTTPDKHLELWEAVAYDTLPPGAYKCLAAVASSLFAAMAVRERGPGGRARRGGGMDVVSMADFAANSLRVPRHLVAAMVKFC